DRGWARRRARAAAVGAGVAISPVRRRPDGCRLPRRSGAGEGTGAAGAHLDRERLRTRPGSTDVESESGPLTRGRVGLVHPLLDAADHVRAHHLLAMRGAQMLCRPANDFGFLFGLRMPAAAGHERATFETLHL